MTAHVIRLEDYRPRPSGNGARETLVRLGWDPWDADYFLADLWCAGFKIVPLEEDQNSA
jgi:hypothetical protein